MVKINKLKLYDYKDEVYILDGENLWVYNGSAIEKVKFIPDIKEGE